jgi:hypothetical protein
MTFAINVVVSAVVISFASWLSGRVPVAAGFLVAMPLATMLVLPLSYQQHHDTEAVFLLAKCIFVAIPVSLMFFLPFLLSDRLSLGFWKAYALGCIALSVGYVLHRAVTRAMFG